MACGVDVAPVLVVFGERQDAIKCCFVLGVEFIDGFAKNVVVHRPFLIYFLPFVGNVNIALSNEVVAKSTTEVLPGPMHDRNCVVVLTYADKVFR